MKKGNWIKLKCKTGHGKNRIREHCEDWLVDIITEGEAMLRSQHKTFKVGSDLHFDGRWVDLPTDNNFEIIE